MYDIEGMMGRVNDTYKTARGNSLAGLAFNSQGAERQSALGQLAGINPMVAQRMQNDFNEQDATELSEFSRMILAAPDEIKPQMYERGKQKFAAKIESLGGQVPATVQEALPFFQQLAGSQGSQQQAPAEVRALEWKLQQAGYQQGSPEYTQAMNKALGIGEKWQYGQTASGVPFRASGDKYEVMNPNSRQFESYGGGQQAPQEETVRWADMPPAEQEAVMRVSNGLSQSVAVKDGRAFDTSPKGFNPFAKPEAGMTEYQQRALALAEEKAARDAAAAPKSPKTTEGEKSAQGFAVRMAAAEKELDKVTKSGYKPNIVDYYTAGGGPLTNRMSSAAGQVWKQKQEDWVRAKLRKESGAAIPSDEMEREISMYFPKPGDSPDVIKAKKSSRVEAMRQLNIMGGTDNGAESGAPVKVQTIEQRNALPSGTLYIGPDGQTRKKK